MLLEHLNGLTVCVWACSGCKSFRVLEERIYIKCLLICFFVLRMKIKGKIKFLDECHYKYWESFGVNKVDPWLDPSNLV